MEREYNWAGSFSGARQYCSYCHTPCGGFIYAFYAVRLSVSEYSALVARGWCRSGKVVYFPDPTQCCCKQFSMRTRTHEFLRSKHHRNVVNRVDRLNRGELTLVFPNDKVSKDILPPDTSLSPPAIEIPAISSEDELHKLFTTPEYFEDIKVVLRKKTKEEIDMELEESKSCKTSSKSKVKSGLEYSILEEDKLYSDISACIQSFYESRGEPFLSVFKKLPPSKVLQRADGKNGDFVSYIALSTYSHLPHDDFKSCFALAESISDFCKAGLPFLGITAAGKGFINFSVSELREAPLTVMMETDCGGDEELDSEEVSSATQKFSLSVTINEPRMSNELFQVFCRYQIFVHKDSKHLNEKFCSDFLVDSPLKVARMEESDPERGYRVSELSYGSYHVIYRLKSAFNRKGKVVAVGILDILPDGLNSLYFIWDPPYKHLHLGIYSALYEIDLNQQLGLPFYYIGYYVPTCEKMQYKLQYRPSEMFVDGGWREEIDALKAASELKSVSIDVIKKEQELQDAKKIEEENEKSKSDSHSSGSEKSSDKEKGSEESTPKTEIASEIIEVSHFEDYDPDSRVLLESLSDSVLYVRGKFKTVRLVGFLSDGKEMLDKYLEFVRAVGVDIAKKVNYIISM